MLRVQVQHRAGTFALDAAFDLRAQVVGIFGPSGAGKTTLLNIMAGLARPAGRGLVQLEGETLLDTQRGIDVPAERRRIAVVFQEHRLFPHYTVQGNLEYGFALLPAADRRLQSGAVIDMLELGPLLTRSVRDLSGGERQRLALGRALLSSPRLLLLDEPLSSLDRRLKEQILPYLRRVRDAAGVPMIYVSHDLTEVLRMTDQLLLLQGGRVAGAGPVRELAHEPKAGAALQEAGMVNVLTLRVQQPTPDDGLLSLAVPGGRMLRVPVTDAGASGAMVELTIRPEDIGLALEEVRGSSFQNQLLGHVERVSVHGGRAIVQVDAGVTLLAQVSQRSVESLGLRAGARVFCLIKSLAVRAFPHGDGVSR